LSRLGQTSTLDGSHCFKNYNVLLLIYTHKTEKHCILFEDFFNFISCAKIPFFDDGCKLSELNFATWSWQSKWPSGECGGKSGEIWSGMEKKLRVGSG
jgi:hypothetical protein